MSWITDYKIPIGPYAKSFVDWLTFHGEWFFNQLSSALMYVIGALLFVLQKPAPLLIAAIVTVVTYYTFRFIIVAVIGFLAATMVLYGLSELTAIQGFFVGIENNLTQLGVPSPRVLIALMSLLALWLRRSIIIAVLSCLGLLLIMNQGYWKETTETLALVLASTFVSMAAGIPLGIAGARHTWFFAIMRPVLDLMQTIPTFVYLIPALILFGLGMVPGLIATVIFAIPAPIRLTRLGIISTPPSLVEAAYSFGATPMQTLRKVELPYAMPQIMAGLTQTIMLSLSMVVIAALVGANGLGTPVVRALNTVNVAMGFQSGLCIVILAIILDRMFRPDGKGNNT